MVRIKCLHGCITSRCAWWRLRVEFESDTDLSELALIIYSNMLHSPVLRKWIIGLFHIELQFENMISERKRSIVQYIYSCTLHTCNAPTRSAPLPDRAPNPSLCFNPPGSHWDHLNHESLGAIEPTLHQTVFIDNTPPAPLKTMSTIQETSKNWIDSFRTLQDSPSSYTFF